MAVVGAGAVIAPLSYLAIGRETTYGTYPTCTAGLNFLSAGLVATKETKILEEIQTVRTNSNFISLGKVIEGEIECYYSPISLAANYLLQNAMGGGGAAASGTATGETVGGLGFLHNFTIGNFDVTYMSLSINLRKGDSATGKVFQYTGVRVNECSFSAEMDEALKVTYGIVAQDVTVTTNDVASAISTLTQKPLSFVNGRFSVESTFASLSSSVFWHVQAINFTIKNNLATDVRRIGSDLINRLPAGLAQFDLSCTMRFDTTTAWDAMMAGTVLAAEFEFTGETMTGSQVQERIKFQFPKVVVMDAGDPEIGGPNEVLTSEVTFAVLRDASSATGYAVRAQITNLTSTYV